MEGMSHLPVFPFGNEAVAFAEIASATSRQDVADRIAAASRDRNDVVSVFRRAGAAIGTLAAVAAKQALPISLGVGRAKGSTSERLSPMVPLDGASDPMRIRAVRANGLGGIKGQEEPPTILADHFPLPPLGGYPPSTGATIFRVAGHRPEGPATADTGNELQGRLSCCINQIIFALRRACSCGVTVASDPEGSTAILADPDDVAGVAEAIPAMPMHLAIAMAIDVARTTVHRTLVRQGTPLGLSGNQYNRYNLLRQGAR